QLITESLILSIVGGVLGCLLALWGIDALIGLSPGQIPRLSEATIDAKVLGFTLAVWILTGLIFGLVPALQTTKLSLTETLKEGDRGSTEGFRGRRMRNALVVVEVALSLVLLVGAGLMIRSFLHLQRVDPGFNAERLLTVQLGPPTSKYPENLKVVTFYNQLLEKIASTPGVQGVSAVNSLPMTGGASMWAFSIEGQPLSPTGADADAEVYRVSPDYFQMMGIPILSGRGLTGQDHQDAPRSLVINETFAKRYFPGEDPVGKRITFGDPADGEWQTIVGVARDVKHRELDVEAYSQVYATYQQTPTRGMYLMIRTASADPLSFVSAFRTQLWSIDAEQPLYNVKTMDQVMSESIARPRFNMVLMSVFATVALVLAAVGIYGVMSYSVSQRTHEIGIRMALGAQRQDVVRLVVGQGMVLAGAGVVIGAIAAALLTRFISSLLFEISASDPLTFIAISLLLVAVALVACYIPARRATRVDPMIALRYE
ncbi:MAG TPA: ABC transporter permease, partial [Blastocatellia bacterium]|nr:ABC transporter permease [Blastocatellia bacterium]